MTSSSCVSSFVNTGVPGSLIGKRSRSSSISSISSTAASSQDGSSVFSQAYQERSVDSSSSCSSPSSEDLKSSPSSLDDCTRPCKTLRSDRELSSSDAEVATLEKLGDKCRLEARNTDPNVPSAPSSPASAEGGKSLFVDCLVEASVHVLDMIWNAPIPKSIAFLKDAQSVTDLTDGDINRPCRCPIGAPITGGIPLNLFVRETLRRSRTSCSTLQAALLYCKRIGHQVLRSRAEMENVALSQHDTRVLDELEGHQGDTFASRDLSQRHGLNPLLCSRRAFLASVMVSSKFLQDRTFSNRAWSKISGLTVQELGLVERRMLDAVGFQLAVNDSEWQKWTRYMRGEWKQNFASSACPCQTSNDSASSNETRKGLERANSLQVSIAVDMEHQIAPPASTTPINGVRRRLRLEHALPADEFLTPRQAVVNDTHNSNSGPILPFPMRKGLNARSISAR